MQKNKNNKPILNELKNKNLKIKMQNKGKKFMKEFKSGFVTVIGKTNVGKSSLINKLTGEKVSAVTSKSQTTRKNVKAIVNRPNSQIIFIDTPGFHKPLSKLSNIMNEEAIGSIPDVDIILYMVDAKEKEIDEKAIEKIKESGKATILLINKIDLVKKEDLAKLIEKYSKVYDFKAIIPISVKSNKNLEAVFEEIENNLEPGEKYYDDDEYTDQTMREIVEEIIREKALKLLRDEVPHGIYVEVTKMKMGKTLKNEKIYNINATIYCLRNSHKGIIVGKGGSMLKKIGTYSREDIEKMLGTKVNLQLYVKVNEDWINNDKYLKQFKSKEN